MESAAVRAKTGKVPPLECPLCLGSGPARALEHAHCNAVPSQKKGGCVGWAPQAPDGYGSNTFKKLYIYVCGTTPLAPAHSPLSVLG